MRSFKVQCMSLFADHAQLHDSDDYLCTLLASSIYGPLVPCHSFGSRFKESIMGHYKRSDVTIME